MGYLKEEERVGKYDPLYIEWLNKFVRLRKLRGVSRQYMADMLGMKYRTYYKKEVMISSFKMYELAKAFELIGFRMDIVCQDIFTHDKKGKRKEY